MISSPDLPVSVLGWPNNSTANREDQDPILCPSAVVSERRETSGEPKTAVGRCWQVGGLSRCFAYNVLCVQIGGGGGTAEFFTLPATYILLTFLLYIQFGGEV